MCGIGGSIVLRGERRVTDASLVAMADAMRLRGPDGFGTWVSSNERVGLIHRRLAIIDLSAAANQPMVSADGRLRIVFNGEIYNHAELRQELIQAGVTRWTTDHADTEVVLNGFLHWGIGVLDRVRGMFAFALWDERERDLWLVRDHMGIKPLYYSETNGRLSFASEIKALLTDPEQRRAVNERALFHYLSFIATPAPDTLFDGIKKLPNGCLLRVDASGKVEERRWYDLWTNVVPSPGVPEKERCERLLGELRTTVRLQKVGDVPVGVFLSGGVDSSTNVALFTESSNTKVKTFSIGYDTDYASYTNELHHAEAVAKRFGTDHYERRLKMADLIDFLPTMTRLQDEPIADPVCVPLYFVAQLARENGVIVCQAGEGADELFFGYENWRTKWKLQRLADNPFAMPAMALVKPALMLAGASRRKSFEALERVIRHQPLFWGTTEAFTHRDKYALLSPRMRQALDGETSWSAISPIWDRFRAGAWEPSWMHWMTYVDLNARLPELLLMRLDKMTMGVSLEGRVPFLDHKFAEHVMGIPEGDKIGGGELKHLFKKSVRGVIPDSVIDRKKQGFGVPVTEWLLGALGTHIRETLSGFLDETDYLNRDEVMRICDNPSDDRVWYLYNLASWWNTYIK